MNLWFANRMDTGAVYKDRIKVNKWIDIQDPTWLAIFFQPAFPWNVYLLHSQAFGSIPTVKCAAQILQSELQTKKTFFF